ncbi:MAG: glutamate--cysteine ligase [Plesiomonas sp.]|uniref:glutamate--cysteine ligase n=1 Tax=Plesiomonas sp. TaxID=2486279 RepID=UPI003F38BDF3
MIPDVSAALSWLAANPHVVQGLGRGIERETLRITPDGHLAQTGHAPALGSALTHSWITTDFAESLLEFITPVERDVDTLLTFLRDIQRYTARNIGDELFWPLSMPCFIGKESDIVLAQYGKSNVGRLKTLYREGLKNRYGALMQVISGVHYNFSLPDSFWLARFGNDLDPQALQDKISDGYLKLIRNYYRFGWVIPYLFGASPALCRSFIAGREDVLPFESNSKGLMYLQYATSLRMSDLGYTNKEQSKLGITFNQLRPYVDALKKAIHQPSLQYANIGVKVGGEYRQLNSNVLQIENEFYAPIRPKRVTLAGESPSDALLRGGIQYIEVRALDNNPFSAIGIDAEQVRFLDLFMIWCALADAPEMSESELLCCRKNWNRVILEGRKPGQTVGIGCEEARQPLADVGQRLFTDLLSVAIVLDGADSDIYQQLCTKLMKAFVDPSLTLSAQVLDQMLAKGIRGFGLELAKQYQQQLSSEALAMLSDAQFAQEQADSFAKQTAIEAADTLSFDDYLASQKG